MSSQEIESGDDFFDASKLSESSLRKYQVLPAPTQSYFKIDCTDDDLREKVKHHFENDFKIEPNIVLERFLKLKRDEKDHTR